MVDLGQKKVGLFPPFFIDKFKQTTYGQASRYSLETNF